MSTTSDNVGGPPAVDNGIAGDPEVRAEIGRRLEEITAPDYVDPARKDFTSGDWIALAGFLAVCAVAFTVWGY
jgi:hypothetical protein